MIARTRPTSRTAGHGRAEDVRPLVLDPDREEPHPRRLARERPEHDQVARGRRAPTPPLRARSTGAREASPAVEEARGDHPEQRGHARTIPFRIAASAAVASAAGHEADACPGARVARRRAPGARPARGRRRCGRPPVAHLAADVGDQADALRRQRLAHLGRLGDPLDQALGLVARRAGAPRCGRRARSRAPARRILELGLASVRSKRLLRGPARARARRRARPPRFRARARSPPRSRPRAPRPCPSRCHAFAPARAGPTVARAAAAAAAGGWAGRRHRRRWSRPDGRNHADPGATIAP